MHKVALLKWTSLALLLPVLSACSALGYYGQAISGHLDLMSREKPIETIVNDQQTNERLKKSLLVSQRARDFATKELHLPENDSYKSYADLERPYVVWNVVATRPYSIKPKQWCFLIVGCLSYQGYFDKQEAYRLARELEQQGMDVSVFGSAAYSTLGYFDDPLLNTMLRHGDDMMIGTMFHELAHQTVYVENDTAFNEAFATAVEQEGLRRWYDQLGAHDAYLKYLQKKQYRHEFYALIIRTRQKLEQAFTSLKTDQEKQHAKTELFATLKREYKAWSQSRNYFVYDKWMQRELNNSHLALIATYQEKVPNFLNMLASVEGDLRKFYEMVKTIGDKDKEARKSVLSAYKIIKSSSR